MAAMELQPIRNAPASPGTGVLLALQRDGVPAEDAPKVKELQTLLAADIEKYGDAALADATTLLRFLRAREHDVAEAAKMWRAAHAWREHHVRTALAECGADDASSTEGWRWRQHADAGAAPTPRGRLALAHGMGLRLDAAAADGSPVLYWALGELDVGGVAREDLADCLLMRQVAHLEDALQASRAVSRAEKRLVRCRLVIDLRGLRVLALLRRLGVVKRITAIGKTYFPEVTASATLINAPAGVETLWRGVSVFLNAAMRAKVRIVGRDYREALTDHAKIDDYDLLPARLGGKAPDPPLPRPVPTGAGAGLEPFPVDPS